VGDGLEGVLDLIQTAFWREDGCLDKVVSNGKQRRPSVLGARSWEWVQVQLPRRLTRESYLRDMFAVSLAEPDSETEGLLGRSDCLSGLRGRVLLVGMRWVGWRRELCEVVWRGCWLRVSVTAGNWSLTIEGAPGKRRHASMGECCRGQDPRTHVDGFPRLMGTWGR
jgi:hypothetical protein